MVYYLSHLLLDTSFTFNLFEYIPFRAGCAMLTAFLISLIFGPKFIFFLKSLPNHGQPIRLDGPQEHLNKQGIPTMGGTLILISILLSSVIWTRGSNSSTLLVAFTAVSFGTLGWVDDYLKLSRNDSRGLSVKTKLFYQVIISLASVCICLVNEKLQNGFVIPFCEGLTLNSKWLSILLGVIVLVGSSNAVNLSDGLDGLATGLVIMVSACFALIAYLVEPCIIGSGELSIICCSITGAGLGFLWFNAPPAKVFMGDTGSLAIGSTIGIISVLTKHELTLAVIGGLFVVEASSVIIQVVIFKITSKRVFLMSPIHHHFEKKGIAESAIVIRFWIVGAMLAVLGLLMVSLEWCSYSQLVT